jgi:uncharacterized protein (TIGR02996 family)
VSQAELEAAIESHPDDPSAYEVYADWLESQGDPRGRLISLQLAAWRAPADKKLARAAAAHLAAHREQLFPFDGESLLDPTWFAGFLRAIRFRYDDATGLASKIRAIVRHPSGRFLQAIVLPDTRLSPIVKVLVEDRLPTTLAQLRAANITDAVDAELRAAFPRYGTELAPDWRKILQSIRGERRTDLKYDLAILPPLEPLGTVDVADARPEELARGLKLELEGTRRFDVVSAIRRSFTDASRDAFAIALAEQFFAHDTTPTRRWGFEALAAIGDAGAALWIRAQLPRWSIPRAQQGIELLSQLAARTPMALSVLFALDATAGLPTELRVEAQHKLAYHAMVRKVTLPALAENLPALEAATVEIMRGTRVEWTKGKRTRTGTVFWIGKAKHGEGIRVGIREDATEETLWANEADCRVL